MNAAVALAAPTEGMGGGVGDADGGGEGGGGDGGSDGGGEWRWAEAAGEGRQHAAPKDHASDVGPVRVERLVAYDRRRTACSHLRRAR